VKNVRVHAGTATSVVARCPKLQRLVSATHAVAFYGSTPPTARLVEAVTVHRRAARGVVTLKVRATRAIAETPTVVQLDLLCVPR
jgi:cob(I)alamin adenosyltransferase